MHNCLLIQQHFAEIRSLSSEYFEENRPAVQKTPADATISPPLEPSVEIIEYSDDNDLISAKCC
jgi:hypothetical protein